MSFSDQLLVLGNGFDLQCGLASSFKDFEETRKKTIDELLKTYFASGNNADTLEGKTKVITYPNGNQGQCGASLPADLWDKHITAWDLVLIEDERVRTWYDVEACIRDWLLNRPRRDQLREENQLKTVKSYIQSYKFSNLQQDLEQRRPKRTGTMELKIAAQPSEVFVNMPVDEQVAMLIINWYSDNTDEASIIRVMMRELHRLEMEFSNYLNSIMEKNEQYYKFANDLLVELLNDQLTNSDGADNLNKFFNKPVDSFAINGPTDSARILDFNFTNPVYEFGSTPDLINIHGDMYGEDIIFGIDGNNVDNSIENYSELVKFTKTFRLMALSKGPKVNLVRPHLPGQPGSETSIIKFFGHSLGDPDYSYFQAIFDEVDLYESNTHLIFYYNQNRTNEKDENEESSNDLAESAQEDMFEKVNRLITTYGQTLDNKDHGRNLMHKLLLENRLRVIQAPGCPKASQR